MLLIETNATDAVECVESQPIATVLDVRVLKRISDIAELFIFFL